MVWCTMTIFCLPTLSGGVGRSMTATVQLALCIFIRLSIEIQAKDNDQPLFGF